MAPIRSFGRNESETSADSLGRLVRLNSVTMRAMQAIPTIDSKVRTNRFLDVGCGGGVDSYLSVLSGSSEPRNSGWGAKDAGTSISYFNTSEGVYVYSLPHSSQRTRNGLSMFGRGNTASVSPSGIRCTLKKLPRP